jgi:hypothetical protein
LKELTELIKEEQSDMNKILQENDKFKGNIKK